MNETEKLQNTAIAGVEQRLAYFRESWLKAEAEIAALGVDDSTAWLSGTAELFADCQCFGCYVNLVGSLQLRQWVPECSDSSLAADLEFLKKDVDSVPRHLRTCIGMANADLRNRLSLKATSTAKDQAMFCAGMVGSWLIESWVISSIDFSGPAFKMTRGH